MANIVTSLLTELLPEILPGWWSDDPNETPSPGEAELVDASADHPRAADQNQSHAANS